MIDGCESQTAVDPRNCGLCGNVCPGGVNSVAACAAGVCSFACNAGFLDCDKNPANGCEIDGSKDAANCGKCGTVCGNGFLCSKGACVAAVQWVFANYNAMMQTPWNGGKQWNGTISCSVTCGFLGQRAIGVRFICNLAGAGATEGCDANNDGKPGNANCGKSIDNGIVINMNGNSEDCANGMIANCVAAQCTEGVTYHAIECQCGP